MAEHGILPLHRIMPPPPPQRESQRGREGRDQPGAGQDRHAQQLTRPCSKRVLLDPLFSALGYEPRALLSDSQSILAPFCSQPLNPPQLASRQDFGPGCRLHAASPRVHAAYGTSGNDDAPELLAPRRLS